MLTVPPPYINIWIQNWNCIPLFIRENQIIVRKTTQNLWSKINQNFIVEKINQKWCTDFTYLLLNNHEVKYNYTITGMYDRSVIANITDWYITSDLAIRTLQKAIDSQPQIKGKLILHSDHEAQFTLKAFVEYCVCPCDTEYA